MDQSELLNKFFDGQIEPNEEESLFNSLATNASLRKELKNLIDIEKAVKSDFGVMFPPVETTSALFSNSNISTQSIVTKAPFMASFKTLILSNLLTLIIASSLVYLGMNYFNNNSNLIKSANHTQSSIQNQNNAYNYPVISNLNVNSSNDNSLNPNKSQNNISNNNINNNHIKKSNIVGKRIVDKSNDKQENSNNDQFASNPINLENHSSDVNQIEPPSVTNSKFNAQANTNLLLNKNNDIYLSKMQSIDFPIPSYSIKQLGLNNLSLTFSGGDSWSLPKATVPRSSQPLFNNNAITLTYNLNKNFSFGIDFRQEYFYQKYNGIDKDKQEYIYEQNTNYSAFGLLARENILNYDYFKTFVQTYLGLNKIGPIGRLMFGLEINPREEYGFIFTVEGSSLRYFHQNNYYWSNKIGAYYGIILHF